MSVPVIGLTARIRVPGTVPAFATAEDTVWQTPGWRRFVEGTGLHDVRQFEVVEDGEPVALGTLLVTPEPGGLLFYDLPRLVGTPGAMAEPDLLDPDERRRWDTLSAASRLDRYPTAVLATFGNHHGVVHAAGRTAGQRRAVMTALPALLARVADDLGCRSAALLYLDHADASAVAASGWTPLLLGAEGVHRLPAGDPADYLAGLSTRRRTRLRRETREYTEAGFRTVVRHGPSALDDEVLALQVAHRAKYGLPGGEELVRRDFDALRATVGENCVVLGAARDGRLHGFVLYLRHGPALFGRTAGFAPDTPGCYLTLTYHETARWAMENGIRRIHYGMAAYEAKVARGCTLDARWGFVTGVSPELVALQSATVARRLDRVGAPVTPLTESGATA